MASDTSLLTSPGLTAPLTLLPITFSFGLFLWLTHLLAVWTYQPHLPSGLHITFLSQDFLHLHVHVLFFLGILWSHGILSEAFSDTQYKRAAQSHPLPSLLATLLSSSLPGLIFHRYYNCDLKYYILICCLSKPYLSFVRAENLPILCIVLSPNSKTQLVGTS